MVKRLPSMLAATAAVWCLSLLAAPAAAQEAQGPFRRLARGVMHTITPETNVEESASHHDIIGLLALDPRYGERPSSPNLAKNVRLTHNIWGLEFNFKPVRMEQVDVPNPDGKFDRKNIWYMVYNVRNPGPEPVKFIPRFLLQSIGTGEDGKDKFYADRVIPVASGPIQNVEDPNRKLLNSVEISEQPIPVSGEGENKTVWGVATWEDVDPDTDEFAVYVQGLTNAYRRTPAVDAAGNPVTDENGKPQWKFYRKTLKLNFWRPGDEFHETDAEIRFSAPGKVDHTWEYK